MFISINKKIVFSILAFLLFILAVFFALFISLYAKNLRDNQNSVYLRNQYVVGLLYDNIDLRKELSGILKKYPEVAADFQSKKFQEGLKVSEKELSREQKLNAELQKNYNSNREALSVGAKIIGFSMFVVLLCIFLWIFMLNRWVIQPVEKLTEISKKVALGIFSSRIKPEQKQYLQDEFNVLYSAFNSMLDNVEHNIEEVKNRENFLQNLLDTIPDGIRVIDRNYNVVMVNTAFNNLLKIRHSCIEKKCYQAYGCTSEGCQQRKYTCPLQELLIERKNNDFHTIHEVGKTPLYLNASRFCWGDGLGGELLIESFHDLSGDVRFSHQQKVASLAFLSTSIAHEMKNNLGAIRLIFEGLLSTFYQNVPDDDKQKKYLLMTYNQLVETIKTPERLLRLAQYSDNEDILIDVESCIKDMLLMIDYDAKRYGITVKTQLESGVNIYGNESDFKMIVLNLTQNAIKAMPDGGTLLIKNSVKNKNLYLHVADTGTGISEKKLKHIFEPFYSDNKNARSSGLGLAIVSSLMEKFHGRISVKSKEGKGTTFTLKFPLAAKK